MNKNGSTLIITVFLVMLMSMLALALFTIAVSDNKQVVQQDHQMQSYYLARSGADAVAEFLIKNPLEVDNINGNTSATYSYGDGVVEITATVTDRHLDGTPSEIQLLSVGTVEERSKTVTLTLGDVAYDQAIFCDDDLVLDKMFEVEGDLGSNGYIVDYAPNGDPIYGRDGFNNDEYMGIEPISWGIPTVSVVTSDLTENSAYTFDSSTEEANAVIIFDSTKPSIEDFIEGLYEGVPSVPTYTTKLANATIAQYENIRLNLPSDTIEFDTTSGDVVIITNNLELKGDLRITGTHKVIICVNNIGDVFTPNQYNITHPDQLMFFLAPNAKFTFQTPAEMNARIIGPEADVYMSAGTLNGSVISGTFEGTGQATVKYVDTAYDYLMPGFRRKEWK